MRPTVSLDGSWQPAREAWQARAVKRKILLSWSSGKDSAWCLHLLRQQDELEVVGLLTTVDARSRVAMHAVRETLLDAQAEAAGVPLLKVPVPWPCSNAQYEQAVGNAVARAKGVSSIAFGDLFLEDIRRYREGQMKHLALEPFFPLWGRPTKQLAREMIASGLRAVVTCVDLEQLPARFAAAQFDSAFLD